MKHLLFTAILCLLSLGQAALGQIPRTISYQGILTDASGTVVPDGNYVLTFKIYNVPTGGTELWAETQIDTVVNGIFNVILGSITPLNLPFDEPYWLGITVGTGTELTPRIELTSAAYSLSPAGGGAGNTLDQAYDQGGPGFGRIINADAGAVNIDGWGGLTVNSWVGIGTTTPEHPLHVKGFFKLEGSDLLMVDSTRGDGGRALVHMGNGSGTDDQMILNFAGDFEQGVKIDGTKLEVNGKVGIGTANPSQRLEVADTIYSSLGGFKFPDGSVQETAASGTGGGGNTLDQAYDEGGAGVGRTIIADAGAVNIDGPDGLRVNGWVGIGTSAPEHPLHVKGFFKLEGADFRMAEPAAGDGGRVLVHWGDGSGTNDQMVLNFAGDFEEGVKVEGSKLVVDGNLGIGTANPQNKLHVKGWMQLEGSDFWMADSFRGDGGRAFVHMGSGNNTDDQLILNFAGDFEEGVKVEGSKLEINGKVGIGTAVPTQKLEVADTIYSSLGGFKFPDGSVQETAASRGGGNTLDQAYDQGGPGAGRTITADAGAVNINGPDGLTVATNVGIGTTTPTQQLEITGNFSLPYTTITAGDSAGIILSGGKRFLHNFGSDNFFAGQESGNLTTTGSYNTGVGYRALNSNQADQNSAFGAYALLFNTSGSENTAMGYNALLYNTTGYQNVAIGTASLENNSDGYRNTALGYYALRYNNGTVNTALGASALNNNDAGSGNTAAGGSALEGNTTGDGNTAVGANALQSNTTGGFNTAIGINALQNNTAGGNTATGAYALWANTTGIENTAMGVNALTLNTQGQSNTAVGNHALYSNTQGYNNAAIGASALKSNTGGTSNTAVGFRALRDNLTGGGNTATGIDALLSNTTGYSNTANGAFALWSNTEGFNNTGIGILALGDNSTGENNTATGAYALNKNTMGRYNTAGGSYALYSNTWGHGNTAFGDHALYSNINGDWNTAVGDSALYSNTFGAWRNTAVGFKALYSNTTGDVNTAFGGYALYLNTSGGNTAVGDFALYSNTTGDDNTAVGMLADVTIGNLANATAIGYFARVNASNKVVMGNTDVTVIGGYANWSNLSDSRFKRAVREDVKGLDFITRLRPVSYQMDIPALNAHLGVENKSEYVSNSNKGEIVYSGFIGQEVEAAAREVGYDFSGVVPPQNEKDHYSLRYAEFVVPLVKAVQEQQKIIEQLQKEVAELKRKLGE